MDNIMKQAETLAAMCHNQSMFLAECVSNPVSTLRVLTEKEVELNAYFRKQGTSSK